MRHRRGPEADRRCTRPTSRRPRAATDSWVDAVKEIGTLVGVDYDLSAEIPNIKAPTLVMVGDWDAVRISAATKLFEMLGGGAQDANWDRSGMGQNHFAVIPNATPLRDLHVADA